MKRLCALVLCLLLLTACGQSTSTKPSVEPPTESTEQPAESATESTEQSTEAPTEPTEQSTQPTEQPTEAPTEAPTESTEQPAESATESTEQPSESATESTEQPAESSTKSTEQSTNPPEAITEQSAEPATEPTEQPAEPTTDATSPDTDKEETQMLHIQAGESEFTATWADNSSVDALKELLAEGPLTLTMSDYAQMEKGADLGVRLPQNNQQMNTTAGDIILYQGRTLVIYYDQNSWSLTPIAKIEGVDAEKLRAALGDGDVTVTFSLE